MSRRPRVSVPIPSELLSEVRRTSEAARLAKQRVDDAQVIIAYAEWSHDDERLSALDAVADAALAKGGAAESQLNGR